MRPSLGGARWWRARWSSVYFAIALVPAVAQLVCFLVALALRFGYPMDLEWLEGPPLYESFRIARGLPVFGPPSQGFVPCPYPPLYHLAVCVLGRCFGFDYWNGRLVSDVSIAVVVALQSAAVMKAAPTRRLGALLAVMGAAGVAAAYRPLEASMDLARVDMMGFALIATAAWLAQRSPLDAARSLALGVAMCAAVYTKQTNVFYVGWILVYLAWRDRRGAALSGAVAVALAVPPFVLLQRATGGWFWRWMTIMRHHAWIPAKCAVAGPATVVGVAAVAGVVVAFHRRRWLREPTRFWCGMLAASLPACVAPTLTWGGWVNNLIGLVLVLLLLALLLACDAMRAMAGDETAARWIVSVASALLLGALYDPILHVPDAAHRRDVAALHHLVRALDGDVLVPMYPFVAPRDGKATPQVSLLSYFDSNGKGGLALDIPGAVRAGRPRWVLLVGHELEDEVPAWLGPEYTATKLDLRVQALKESTGRELTLLERAPGED
jgi:hypothetical protein